MVYSRNSSGQSLVETPLILMIRVWKVYKEYLCSQQISVLKHTQVGEFVANEFSALVDKCDDTLTKDNFCQVRILYKQRIFENIIKESSKASLEYKQHYLTSLIRTAEEAPVELVLLYLNQVFLFVYKLLFNNFIFLLSYWNLSLKILAGSLLCRNFG